MSTITEYQSLLLDFIPRPIRTEAEHRRTMRQIERLMRSAKLSRAEGQLLELLATLVEQYESAEYPTPKVSQPELLAHLIDARGVTQTEVSRQAGRAAVGNQQRVQRSAWHQPAEHRSTRPLLSRFAGVYRGYGLIETWLGMSRSKRPSGTHANVNCSVSQQ